jgi:hypothetical protein
LGIDVRCGGAPDSLLPRELEVCVLLSAEFGVLNAGSLARTFSVSGLVRSIANGAVVWGAGWSSRVEDKVGPYEMMCWGRQAFGSDHSSS